MEEEGMEEEEEEVKEEEEEEEEDEMEVLSPDSETGESESEREESLEHMDQWMDILGPLLIVEGSPRTQDVLRKKARELQKVMVRGMMKAKKAGWQKGYEEAVSPYKAQVEDVEYLLEEERRERKSLEEVSKTAGVDDIKGWLREKMEASIGNYERRRGEERLKEWKSNRLELGVEMRKAVDGCGEERDGKSCAGS